MLEQLCPEESPETKKTFSEYTFLTGLQGVSSCCFEVIEDLVTYLRQRRREETQMRMTPRLRKTMNW